MRPNKVRIAILNRRAAIKIAVGGVAAALTATCAQTSEAATALGSGPAIAPLQTEFTYEALVTIAPAVEIGSTSRGIRRYIPITGGQFSGPRIKGIVLPGGADWQMERPDGVTEVNALYSMKTDDGAVIVVHNRGLLSADGSYFRTIPEFEAPTGPHDWLNKAVFVGSVAGSPRPGAVIVRSFRVL